MSPPLFEVTDLRIAVFDQVAAARNQDQGVLDPMTGEPLGRGWVEVVAGISFHVAPGEALALVGESASGKSITMMGTLGLLGSGAKAVGGAVTFRGARMDPWAAPEDTRNTWRERRRRRKRSKAFMGELLDADWRRVMGTEIGILFQDPVASWSPDGVIGRQAGEVLAEHSDLDDEEIERRVLDALGEVNLPGVRKYASFRHELSRGEAQRAMLAAALVKAPSLIVADEPLAGLDAAVGAAILDLLRDMKRSRGLAMIIATHDLATVASIADRVAVVYGGQIVEQGPADEIFASPRHPYTEGLLGSIPWAGLERLRPIAGSPPPLVEIPRDRCSFADRCDYAQAACLDGVPELTAAGRVRCVRSAELDLRGVGGR